MWRWWRRNCRRRGSSTGHRVRARVPWPKPPIKVSRVGPRELGLEGAADIGERHREPDQRDLAIGVHGSLKRGGGARCTSRRQRHRARRRRAAAVNAHLCRHGGPRRRRLNIELRLIRAPHLAARKLKRDYRARLRAAERRVVHEAPPLQHVVDAVDRVAWGDVWCRRAHVKVHVRIVTDRRRSIGQAVDEGLGAYLLICQHLLLVGQVQAVGHRQLPAVCVDVHRHRARRRLIHATSKLLSPPKQVELSTRAPCARAGHIKHEVGCPRVTARPICVQMTAPIAVTCPRRIDVDLHLDLQLQAARANHVEAQRADVKQPRPPRRAHARDRRKVYLPRVGRIRDRATEGIPRGPGRPTAA